MDPSEFHAPEAGQIVTGPEGYAAFVPAPLPPKIAYSRRFTLALSRADAALGELTGLGAALPHPASLAAPFIRQEALCSARIEGAEVKLSEVLLDEVAAAPATASRDQLFEVRNCIATLQFGVERLAEAPLSLALVRDLHERLLRGEPTTARTPGEFRTTQNWIGPPGSTLATALYVPPPAAEMQVALGLWERFVRERDRLPDLLQCAMMHEQFQAIHPFIGGNGRLGRVLITLFLIERRRLTQPLLYLSAFLEANREEYYALLQRVRTHGEWKEWLLFFFEGVRVTAVQAARQARALLRQRARYRSNAKGTASLRLVDELFMSPYTTVPEVERALAVSSGTARRAMRQLESTGLLERLEGTHRPSIFVALPILAAVERPLEALIDEAEGAPEGELLKSGLGRSRKPIRPSDRLMAEAKSIIDTARSAGVQVRLTGGLAVRRHCVDLEFMDREYSDIDLVGLSDQGEELNRVFVGLGYVENRYVTQSTAAGQLQYIKHEALKGEPGEAPKEPLLVDHVDIFMDVMRMDHDIDARGRLDIDDYAISPVDTFIAKMQIGKINQKDVHDVIALLKDLPLRDTDDDMSIHLPYLAEVCAEDWGIYKDITRNLQVVTSCVDDYGLPEDDTARVRRRLLAIEEAIEEERKSLRWKLRAAVGERVSWRREVEDSEGAPVIAPEWDWRRDLG